MVCECIPPPPIFDLEPPPDPSFIFEYLSDEPISLLRQAQLESCNYVPVLEVLDITNKFSKISPEILPIILLALLFILITTLIIIIIVIKYKRSKHTTRSNSIKKLSSSGPSFDVCGGSLFCTPSPQYNVVLNNSSSSGESNGNWSIPYEKTLRNMGKGNNKMYGSTSNHDIFTYKMSYPINTNTSKNMLRPSHSTTLRFPLQEEGYCTVRHYDDITGYAEPDVTIQTFRKPPPKCPPPPPPNRNNSCITNILPSDNVSSCSSSTEKELEKIHQHDNSTSPIGIHNNIKYPHGGRESGYGTGPSRLQHHISSPKNLKTKKYVSPNTSFNTGQEENMTYV
uniref:Uncharacterized protein n=1 Tax=Strongyloides stercoralis TaxID=6248 RepID=A0A0K0DXF8_STRER